MAYETLGIAVRPYELSERLAGVLKSRCETDCDLWTFAMLSHPHLRDWAATQAAGANMIIIAARGDQELPDHVKTWMESWLPQRREGLATLVGILGEEAEPSGQTWRLCAYLRQMAEKGHMRFFCQADRWSQPDVNTSMKSSPISRRQGVEERFESRNACAEPATVRKLPSRPHPVS